MKKLIKWLLIPMIFLLQTESITYSFYDVTPGDRYYVAITHLKEMGIIKGYEDNSFKSTKKITRAEALKVIIFATNRFTEEEIESASINAESDLFSDVSEADWYAKIIAKSKQEGLINGYEDGTFKPNNTINLAESLKMYLEIMPNTLYPNVEDSELFADTPDESWFAKYIAYAKVRDMLEINLSNQISPNQEMTRGYLTEIIYRNIKFSEEYKFGKATFYGSAVQGNGTSSGEIFDMNSFTAAHRTLPFGTMVEVTNLANGKIVIVKINDRGPYGAGRELDLSSSAFSSIASLGAGVINIQYKVIK